MLERRHPEGLNVPGKQAIANALITSFVGAAGSACQTSAVIAQEPGRGDCSVCLGCHDALAPFEP